MYMFDKTGTQISPGQNQSTSCCGETADSSLKIRARHRCGIVHLNLDGMIFQRSWSKTAETAKSLIQTQDLE